jgi:hypothetical protein
VLTTTKLGVLACLVLGLGILGCGGSGKEQPAAGEAVTGDALEECLAGEGIEVEPGEGGPIQFGNAGTFTPQAVLVHSPLGSPSSVPRQDILVLEPQDAESYDRSLPPGVKDKYRFGPNVLVGVTDVGPPGPVRLPKVPADVSRALDACVS